MLKRIALGLTVSLVLGFLGVYVVAGRALFEAHTYQLQNPNALVVSLCGVALATVWLAPAERIRLLCLSQDLQVRLRSAVLVNILSQFAGAVTPGDAGRGPAVAAALSRLGMPAGEGISLMMQLYVLDMIFYAWAVPLSLGYLIYSDIVAFPTSVKVFTLVAASLAFAGAIVLGRYPRLIVSLLLALAKWPLLKRFDTWLGKIAHDYYRSSKSYLSMPVSSWFKLHVLTALGWLSGFVLLWGLLNLYGVEAGFLAVIALLNIITLASQLVPTPGAAGFTEAAVGLSVGTQAGSIAGALLVWRLATFYVSFLLGPLAGWLLLLSPPVKRSGRRTLR